jgi:uncharacterized protein DUF2865
MARGLSKQLAVGVLAATVVCGVSTKAQARDFFSALFGGVFNSQPPEVRSDPVMRLPFANEGQISTPAEQPRRPSYGGTQAYCVRTCDGRYFPITATDGQSRAASCSSFCPASPTKIVYGSGIDHAATETGKPYSELPNAFRYRTELVAGCTCNGKDQIGLAPVTIEHDPTLRKGDIVAGADGLMVTERGYDKRGAALNMSPAPASVRSRFQRLPVVASD